MTYGLINRLTAQHGHRQEVVDILLESGRAFDGNPNCLMYLVTEATDDPDAIWVVDLWTGQEWHAQAMQDPGMREYVERCLPLLQGMPEQTEVNPVGGIGPTLAAAGMA